MIPLPVTLVNFLSPARGELVRGLQPLFGASAFASLSITFEHLSALPSFVTYCVIFYAVREFVAVHARNKFGPSPRPSYWLERQRRFFGLAQFSRAWRYSAQSGTYGLRNPPRGTAGNDRANGRHVRNLGP